MRTRATFLVAALLLYGTSALAGSTVKMNIVPAPPDCFVGPGFCLNVNGSCVIDNSECALGTMSAKSKIKMKGTLELKAKIKDVTDVTGALLTTGPAESASDNLVLKIAVSTCPVDTGAPPICDDPTNVYLKVVLTSGDGELELDLAPVLSLPAGSSVNLLGISLLDSPGGGNCLGTNSTVDITTRLNDASCEAASVVRGVGGLLTP